MSNSKEKVQDTASIAMLEKAAQIKATTIWDRHDAMQPLCPFGTSGLCCKNCNLGPCRIRPNVEKTRYGVCGADMDTIAARNLVRHIAAGSSCHSDHGREIAQTLLLASKGNVQGYIIKDEAKLKVIAEE